MSQHINEILKEQLIEDFNAVVSGAEQLLQYVSDEGGEKAGALRSAMEKNLTMARARLRELQQASTNKALAAIHSTDVCVHEHPWQAIGLAAGIGAVIGVLTSLLLDRR